MDYFDDIAAIIAGEGKLSLQENVEAYGERGAESSIKVVEKVCIQQVKKK